MSNFRRWYFYVVAAIGLQSVTWAVIALLRNLIMPALAPGRLALAPDTETIAFQISVILIGLPMYLLHWRWAGHQPTSAETGESQPERALYLYVMSGAFLIPFLTNAVGLIQSLLRLFSGTPPIASLFEDALPDSANLAYTGIAIFILGVMLIYHRRLLAQEHQDPGDPVVLSALHHLFIYLFSAIGLAMASVASANIMALLMADTVRPDLAQSRLLINAMAVAIGGLPLWLVFWTRAQALYRSGGVLEKTDMLRKIYLYAVIFFAVLATVGASTAFLAGIFRRLLNLDPVAGSGAVVSTFIAGGLVWAYHDLVLREDVRDMPLQNEQAGVRRLYWYMVAGIGLLALLVGLGGLLGVLFDPGGYIVSNQREQLAWFAALLVIGIAVWLVPWRNIERETAEPDPIGAIASASNARRFYLYFFLLLATLTFLGAAVYILSRLLMLLLGEHLQPGNLRAMGLAAAYSLMAAVVWLYHGRLLRRDQQALEEQQARRAAALQIVVVDDGTGKLGLRLLESLRLALPDMQITPRGLTAGAARAMGVETDEIESDQIIADADIIVGPWSMAASHAGLTIDESMLAAIAASPARKLILPRPMPGWTWSGLDRWNEETAVRVATKAVEEIVSGETALPRQISTPLTILLLLGATFLVIFLLTWLLSEVIPVFG